MGYKHFLYFFLYVNSLKKFSVSKTKLNCFLKKAIFSYSLLPKIFKFRRSSLRLVFLIKILYNIVRTHSPPSPPPPLWREVNFAYLHQSGESEKLEKGAGSMVQGQVVLKRCVCVCAGGGGSGGWGRHFSYLIFSSFIIFTYRNYITLCKVVFCIWNEVV